MSHEAEPEASHDRVVQTRNSHFRSCIRRPRPITRFVRFVPARPEIFLSCVAVVLEKMPVLPNTRVLKLRDMRRKSQKQQPPAEAIDVQGSAGESLQAITDNLGDPFVRTAFRTSRRQKQSPVRVFSPAWHGSDNHGVVEPRCKSPINHKVFDIPYPNASPGKNLMRTPSPRRTSMKTPPLLKVSKRQDHHASGEAPQLGSFQSSAKLPPSCSSTTSSRRKSSPRDSEEGLDFMAPREASSTGMIRKTAQRMRNSTMRGRTRHGSLDMDSLEVSFVLDRALKGFKSMGHKAAKSSSRDKTSKPGQAEIQDEWTEELNRGALVKQHLFLKKRALKKNDTKSKEHQSLSATSWDWDPEDDLQGIVTEPNHTQKLTLPSCLTPGWVDDDDSQTFDAPRSIFAHAFQVDPDDSSECTRRKLLNRFNADDSLAHQAEENLDYGANTVEAWGSFSSSPSDESIFTSSYTLPGAKDSPKKSCCSISDSSGITSTSGEFESPGRWSASVIRSVGNDGSSASRVDRAAKLFRVASCRLSREKSPRVVGKAESIQLECFDSDVTEELSDSKPEVGKSLNRIGKFDSPGSFQSSTFSSRDFNRFDISPGVCQQEALTKTTWVQVHKQGKNFGSCDMGTRGTPHIMDPFALSADHAATTMSSFAATARKEARRAKRLSDIESLATARKKSASRRKSNKLQGELRRSKSQSADHSNLKTSFAPDPAETKSIAMSKSETWQSPIDAHKEMKAAAAVKTNQNASAKVNALPRRQEQSDLDRQQMHRRRHLQSCKEEDDLVTMPEELNGVVKESVALVKSSYNPYNDFKESMIEMIVEMDIQESRDLEELLQCYLSLNAVEYHALIVEVFTEVWCEIFERLQP